MHAGEPFDVLPRIRQRVAGPGERDRRREHQQGDFVVGDAVQMAYERGGSRRVSLLAPRRDGLDVAAVFFAAMRKRRAGSGEMAADGIRAAGAIRSLGGNHRERDVRRAWFGSSATAAAKATDAPS